MDPQDQDNFDDDSSSSSMDDVDLADDESPIDDPAGSASSSRKVIVKIKNYLVPEISAADPPPPPPPPAAAEVIKSHHCKECNRSFSSGKALGGHMSSAHVQANKDYSFKKHQKPSRSMKDYPSGSGLYNHVCNECGKSFVSQKSLYGHMRCHPDRDYRGMVEPRMERSSHASTNHPGFRYTAAPQLDRDDDDQDNADSSGPDALARPLVNFPSFLKAWPVKAKRGRSAKPENSYPPASSDEEEVEEGEITAGHQLLRLLDRNSDPGVKIGNAPEADQVINSKKRGGVEAYHGPGQGSSDWDEARDCKRLKKASNNPSPKLKIWNTNGKIVDDIGKGKDKIVDDDDDDDDEDDGGPENEDELLLGAISVLANGKRELFGRPPVPESYHNSSSPGERLVSPRKDNSGLTLSSSEKHMCSTCKKVFPSHQALGGHRSSHKKLTVSIINTADENGEQKKPKTKSVVNGGVGVKIDGGEENMMYPCKVCDKVFPTGRALGGHKKCHNNYNNHNNNNNISSGRDDHVGNDKDKDSDDKAGEEKVVRGFDLNMMPDDENEPDGDFAGL